MNAEFGMPSKFSKKIVVALADEMFGAGGQLVRSSDTEAAFQAFESGHPQAALDAWQVVFFRQLSKRDIHYAYNPILTACCSYEKAADDLLANFSVTFGAGTSSGDLPDLDTLAGTPKYIF